ncbi:MAG TPA: DNA-directed RNA polymerase subunit D [Candidatus Bathyarchaeia archaeon]|nr:DNA-directed RNA polymerase subunit D [Candidatus Bathyarchaeia archaeon]
MDVKILDRGENEVKFMLSGVNLRFANALRRAMIAEVPKLAIDEVNIHENTSLLYDEQLALRLALIPLKTDLSDYGADDRVSLTLKAISPEREGYTMVYSKELISSEPNVEAAFGNIPIVKLNSSEREVGSMKSVARQKIALEAIAKLGRGKEHAKWQPVTACSYKDMPDEEHKNSLLFTVESDGALPVDTIIEEAMRIMCKKCESVLDGLNEQSTES